MKRMVYHVVLPLALVGAGVGVAYKMVTTAPTAARAPAKEEAPLVEVVAVERAEPEAMITGTGVIEPSRVVTISPEVSGRVTHVSPNLVVGGRVKKGEVLVRLDAEDYRLALRERRSQVKQAELELELERGRGTVAQREWELLSKNDADRPKSALALREPQLEAAQVAVESAEAALARSQRDLEKTVIRAPFNAAVTSEQVETGEIAAPGAVLATLIGTDEFWAEVALPVEQLMLINVPGYGSTEGSTAQITQALGPGQKIVREGKVVRIAKELDRESRTAKVIIAVPTPLDASDGGLPLLPGAFVTASILGKKLQNAVAIPRVAVVEGNRVWAVDENDRLRAHQVQTVFSTHDTVYAVAGIEPGDRVVVSRMASSVEGMEVRTKTAAEPSPGQARAQPPEEHADEAAERAATSMVASEKPAPAKAKG